MPEAADDSRAPVQATIQKESITADAALLIAEVALKAARDKGTQVAVAVVDQAGIPLVMVRTDHSTEHSVGAATDKAWTAVNYKHSTREVFEKVQEGKGDDSQLIHTPRSLFLFGGVPLKDGNEVVGGVGVSGFPSGLDDDATARLSAQAFEAMLKK
jgi:uncharacterized protein GlcG (DUF336 family)